jgi:hypothetical protein
VEARSFGHLRSLICIRSHVAVMLFNAQFKYLDSDNCSCAISSFHATLLQQLMMCFQSMESSRILDLLVSMAYTLGVICSIAVFSPVLHPMWLHHPGLSHSPSAWAMRRLLGASYVLLFVQNLLNTLK